MPPTPLRPPEEAGTRSGYVALVGRPNAGKSTLMNALVGERLSIVTPKAQTTWQRVTGIATSDDTQMIFLDTPGLLDARDLLQRAMLGAALEALHEADVVLAVLDAAREPVEDEVAPLHRSLEETGVPRLAALNKIDLAPAERVDRWATVARDRLDATPLPISASEGTGVGDLRDALRDALPDGPFLYPPDELASDPVRFFVSEMVRETVFEQFRQEVPYSVFCRVQEFRESQDPLYIHVDIFVERNSQKRIIVGEGGRSIRELGRSARLKIERFLGRPVYLDLWVKVLAGWRRKRHHLRQLGFRIPEDHELSAPT